MFTSYLGSGIRYFIGDEDVRFLDRFKRAKDAGFAAVEISTPELYSHSADEAKSCINFMPIVPLK